jgi:hypothetical protein
MATKSAASPAFAQLRDSVHTLQHRVEELVDRIGKGAGALVGKDNRRKMDHLLGQARAFRGDVQKRGAKMLKALEARAAGALSEVRLQVAKRFEPWVGRLSLPSKHEVEVLAKRLSSLEKKVDDLLSARHGRA